jgi:hypothetical protein
VTRNEVQQQAGAGSYDDQPESLVRVSLAVPLLAPARPAPTDATHRPATPNGGRSGGRPSRAHRRRGPASAVVDAVLLGATAAVVVIAGVVVLLVLVDWLS